MIRTGNEVRISGFFPWQSANAEIYTSRKMWPAFGQTDFVRALRFYARARQRRTPLGLTRTAEGGLAPV